LGVTLSPTTPNKFYNDLTTTEKVTRGVCTGTIDLWVLFISKIKTSAAKEAFKNYPEDSEEEARDSYVRERIANVYELAGDFAGYCGGSNVIWQEFISYIQSWPATTPSALSSKNSRLRTIFQAALTIPQRNLDEIWAQYSSHEKVSDCCAEPLGGLA